MQHHGLQLIGLTHIKNISRKKYYLIQSFEDWDGDKNSVIKTWKMKLNKIVIAPWLADIAQKLNEKWILIENGFDQQKFYITTPIEKKDKYSITMLWHDHPLKACNIGLKAIMLVKQKYPELKARFLVSLVGLKIYHLGFIIHKHHRPQNIYRFIIYLGFF